MTHKAPADGPSADGPSADGPAVEDIIAAEAPPHDFDQGPTLRTYAMPADTNPFGDIFGGWLMGQMDVAGGIAATRRAGGRVITAGVEAMSFHEPVFVGDEVSCFCEITRIGRASIRVKVETWSRRRTGEIVKVTEGVFTYVAICDDRRPRVIPALGNG